jgi:glycerol uptake facilitator-like aquaporin
MARFDFKQLEPELGSLKPLVAEALGTVVLVLSAAGAASGFGAVGGLGGASASLALAPALSLLALTLIFGAGTTFNPAVSLGLALSGRLPLSRLIPTLAAQFGGGILAGVILRVLLRSAILGTTTTQMPGLAALTLEALLTFWLTWTYLALSERDVLVTALAVSATVAASIFWAGHLSGASMNPARSFGPALASWDFSDLWIFLIGPFVGAAGAGAAYRWYQSLG